MLTVDKAFNLEQELGLRDYDDPAGEFAKF